MTHATRHSRSPHTLELASDNGRLHRPLMPLTAVEHRLRAVERRLRLSTLPPSLRENAEQQHWVLRAMIDARPFHPASARMLEQRLRWLERAQPPEATADGWWPRLVRRVFAPSPVAA